jgi:hypothetical protein
MERNMPQRFQGLRAAGARRGAAALALALTLTAGPAFADEYDVDHSGHPLRIAAYVLHPVGVLIDRVILRPAHWLGSHEPVKTLFGHKGG